MNPFGRLIERVTILVVLFVVLVLLVTIVLVATPWGDRLFAEEQEFTLGPECGVMPGGLIDQIPDEGTCRNKCRAHCMSREITMHEAAIRVEEGGPCNVCDCTCK